MNKRFKKFEPVLVYLVEANGMYKTHDGFWAGGVEAWASQDVQFQCHADAATAQREIKGSEIIKLRVSAVREPVRRNNQGDTSGVPRDGGAAFLCGWTEKANPWPPEAVECRFWLADWWRANAEAFKSHVEGR